MDLDFSQALKELKLGKSVSRKGWNGQHEITIQFPDANSANTLPYIFIRIDPKKDDVEFPRVPWVASQTDLLEDDWFVEEDS